MGELVAEQQERKLTPKQEHFCLEYIVDLNATQAAIRAGYAEKNADDQASQLLSKTHVQRRIESHLDNRAKRRALTADMVILEVAKLAFADIRLAFNEDGSLKQITEMSKEVAAAISSVEREAVFEGTGRDKQQVGWTTKIRFWDKVKALELLGKNLSLFKDIQVHDVGGTLEQLILQSKKATEPAPEPKLIEEKKNDE